MGKKEEITDVISEKGIREIKVGTVLKFNYEGSPIHIKVTRQSVEDIAFTKDNEVPPMLSVKITGPRKDKA